MQYLLLLWKLEESVPDATCRLRCRNSVSEGYDFPSESESFWTKMLLEVYMTLLLDFWTKLLLAAAAVAADV